MTALRAALLLALAAFLCGCPPSSPRSTAVYCPRDVARVAARP